MMKTLREKGFALASASAFVLAALMAAAFVALAPFAPCATSQQLAQAEEAPGQDNEVDVSQLPDSSFIYDTSIIDLSTADSYYDEQTVQVSG